MFTMKSLREKEFSWPTSLSLAYAAELAYEAPSTIKSTAISRWGFAHAEFLDSSDTQGFIATTPGILLIAFRGSESPGDWIGNLNASSAEFASFGNVHQGMLKGYEKIRSRVTAVVDAASSGTRLWITGHSLGAALSALAAAEIAKTHDAAIAGVQTFGQPRLAKPDFQSYLNQRLGSRYLRFVNHQDIVTRLPPWFEHVGQLVHFDGTGGLSGAVPEAEHNASEPPPLSEEEFARVQSEIRNVSVALVESDALSREAFNASVEGISPAFGDHRLSRYIAIIRRHAFGATSDSRIGAAESESAFGRTIRTRTVILPPSLNEERFPVLLRVDSETWVPPLESIRIQSRLGTFATAQVTTAELESLEADAHVYNIEASRPAGAPELADSVPFVGAEQVHRPPISERGDAALIGIIDTGIDVLHEAFRDVSGQSRILAYWDQYGSGPQTPNAVAPRYFSQTYGRLYLKSEIDTFIASPDTTPVALRDPGEHGTHVAGIAGGRAVGQLSDGMAPEARFIVVSPAMDTDPGVPVSIGYSNSHVDALAFLKSAVAGNLPGLVEANPIVTKPTPIAINVSLGMNAGAHDGSSTLEAAFDSVSGGGRNPGFVIVKSAGNERDQGGHAVLRAFKGVDRLTWESLPPTPGRTRDYFEVWYRARDELKFTLADPQGNVSGTVGTASPQIIKNLGGNTCELLLTENHPDNGQNRLMISVSATPRPIQTGIWTLSVEGVSIESSDGRVDIWVERHRSRGVRFPVADPRVTLSIPGTAYTIITVGACGSSIPLRLTASSSYGRTSDDRPKPDICAPGLNILSAAAGGDFAASRRDTGTSMAAPHVTGALALVLSHRVKANLPQMNARQLQSALIRTARERLPYHNEGVGFGCLDALALFRHCAGSVPSV